jgi:hypothetical protein
MTDDYGTELLRQVRRLVGATDESYFNVAVDRCVRIAAGPVAGGPVTSHNKLNRVIKDCRRTLQSIETLGGISADATRAELKSLIKECELAMREAPAARKSGGNMGSPIRKRLTVELAVELILRCGERLPTVSLAGEVAAGLFEVATGEAPTSMDDYASKFFKELERDGYPDARARKNLDSDGEKAARDHLKSKLGRLPVDLTMLDLTDAVPANERRPRRAASPGEDKTRGGARSTRTQR